MSKTFVAKPGDRWTTYLPHPLILMMYLYRDGKCTFFRENRSGVTQSHRQLCERNLPTPDALAQLREWGYEVRVDEKPAGDDQPITESRVREIVAEMLAANPTPAEVREAAPEPDVKVEGEGAVVSVSAAQVAKWRAMEEMLRESKAAAKGGE